MKFNAAFWKWFGKSSIVDEFGEPLVVYHGSVNTGFTKFEKRAPVRTRSGPDGFYFTSDPNAAASYRNDPKTKKRGTVYAVYLSIQDPLDITADIKKFQKQKMTFGEAKRKALEKLTPEHDGVVFDGNNMNPDEIIAFYPEQIKSINNDGTWDADDPDIRSNPSKSKAVTVDEVLNHAEEADSVGDDAWVNAIMNDIEDYDQWFLGPVKISEIENHNASDPDDIIEDYGGWIDDAPPVILTRKTTNKKYKFFVVDGAHRTRARDLLKRKTIMAYYPG